MLFWSLWEVAVEIKFAFGLLALLVIDNCAAASTEHGCWALHRDGNRPCSANFTDTALGETYYYIFSEIKFLPSVSAAAKEWRRMVKICRITEFAVNGARMNATTVSLNSLDEAKLLSKAIHQINVNTSNTIGPLGNLRFKSDILLAKGLQRKWPDNSSFDFIRTQIDFTRVTSEDCVYLVASSVWTNLTSYIHTGTCRAASDFERNDRSWIICKARMRIIKNPHGPLRKGDNGCATNFNVWQLAMSVPVLLNLF